MSRKIAIGMLAGAAMAGVAQADDVKNSAFRAELMADAMQQESLLTSAAAVGESGGHFGFSDGGSNSLYAGLFFTYRTLFNFRDEDEVGENNDFTWGGQGAYLRAFFFGTVGDENMEYYIKFGVNQAGFGDSEFFDSELASSGYGSGSGGVGLLDMVFQYSFDNGAYVKGGQGRPLQGYEENTPLQYGQFFDDSFGSWLFSPGRQDFIAVGFEGDQLAVEGYLSDGYRSAGTDFPSSAESDIALGGRVNWAPIGQLNQFAPHGGIQHGFGTNAHQSSFVDEDALLVGANFHWQTGGETGVGTADLDVIVIQGDVVFKSAAGFNVQGGFHFANIDPEGGDDSQHFAATVRGGVFVAENIEIYAGYEGVFLDDEIFGSDDTFNFLRVGGNFFPFQDSTAVVIGGELIIGFDNTNVLNSAASLTGNSGFSSSNILGGGDETEFGFGGRINILQ